MKIKQMISALMALLISVPTVVMGDDSLPDSKVKNRNKSYHAPFEGDDEDFDYVIVGFGSAGAIIARALSNNFNNKVLVLEAGSNRMEDPVTLTPNILPVASDLTYNPLYATVYPVPLGGFSATQYSEGREWGGSAAHNGLLAARGVPSDFDAWATNSGDARWSYANILPLLKSVEKYTPNGTVANAAQRGFTGPISITQTPPISSDPLAQAMAAITGSALEPDYNDGSLPNVSTSTAQLFITAELESRRSFSANEYMTIGVQMDAEGRGLNGRKVRVLGNATALRILLEQRPFHNDWEAKGVQYMRTNANGSSKIEKAFARKKVILCAGAINTPKLLMLSGIGDPAILNPLDIDVKVANPNVGANLRNQYGASALITYPDIVPGTIVNFSNASPFMPADDTRRLQILGAGFAPFAPLATFISLIEHPQSLGSVKIVSNDPLTPAQFNQGLYNDGPVSTPGTDAYLMVSFFKIVKDIANSLGQIVVYPPPEAYAGGDAALLAAAQAINAIGISSHATGTTQFGTSIANGVVDGGLNVFGVNKLMIADIGVTNPPVSGNTCLSAYIVGLVAAQSLGVPVTSILEASTN